MPRPLTHTGLSVGRHKEQAVGKLVYRMGEPQKIGIVREIEVAPWEWDSRVLIEWQSGRKTWHRAGSTITIDSKIKEEERVLDTLKNARFIAARTFGVSENA